MKKTVLYIIFISFEFILLGVIIYLGIKIYKLNDRSVKGIQYVTVINKKNLIFEPENKKLEYFYEPKPNTNIEDHLTWLDYEAVYTINSDSLNERFNYFVKKPEDTYRIITIGDSFTFGQYINTQENYSELLEDNLNNRLTCPGIKKFEVINLGVEGYDVAYTVERFIKRGIKYNPDLVIWLLNGHNLDKVNELIYEVRPTIMQEGFLNYNSETRKFEVTDESMKIVKKNYSEEFRLEYHKKAFERLINNYKGKLIIMTSKGEKMPNINLLDSYVLKSSNYIYYSNFYNFYSDKDAYFPDGHPNRVGHRKIANYMLQYLLNNTLNKCDNQ